MPYSQTETHTFLSVRHSLIHRNIVLFQNSQMFLVGRIIVLISFFVQIFCRTGFLREHVRYYSDSWVVLVSGNEEVVENITRIREFEIIESVSRKFVLVGRSILGKPYFILLKPWEKIFLLFKEVELIRMTTYYYWESNLLMLNKYFSFIQLSFVPQLYSIRHRRHPKRSKYENHKITQALLSHSQVQYWNKFYRLFKITSTIQQKI